MGLLENKKLYNSLSLKKKKEAIDFLKTWIHKNDIKKIDIAIKKEPESWFASYHFNWGMAVRNALRTEGCGEKYFGIDNLDDIYVELVEDVIKNKKRSKI